MKKILVFLLAVSFLLTTFSDDKKSGDTKGLTKITAKDEGGTKIAAKVVTGTKITFQYVKGKWTAGYDKVESPDDFNIIDINKVALFSIGKKKNVDKLCNIPPDTENKPFEFVALEDYDSLIIRCDDVNRGAGWSDNKGVVYYKITIELPKEDAAKDTAKDDKK